MKKIHYNIYIIGESNGNNYILGRGPKDECTEWQVNYGCQTLYIYLVKTQIKHLKLPFSLSSIHDQKTIFIQISHIAKSHTHKSIFGST